MLRRLLRESVSLFDDHHRDAGETLFTPYKYGMFSKVQRAGSENLQPVWDV